VSRTLESELNDQPCFLRVATDWSHWDSPPPTVRLAAAAPGISVDTAGLYVDAAESAYLAFTRPRMPT
jgi:hypothetical protein